MDSNRREVCFYFLANCGAVSQKTTHACCSSTKKCTVIIKIVDIFYNYFIRIFVRTWSQFQKNCSWIKLYWFFEFLKSYRNKIPHFRKKKKAPENVYGIPSKSWKKKKKSCQGAKQKVPKLLQNFMIQAPEMEEKTKQNRV